MNNNFRFRPEYQIPELWEQIASCCTPATLRNLSLVHRRMVDSSQRYLFEVLAFRVRQKDIFSNTGELFANFEEPYNSLISRTAERFETLSTSHFSQYVRRWLCEGAIGFLDYHSNPSRHIGLHHTHAIQAFITSLPRYRLLNSLCLSRMEVTSCVLGSLPALPNLKTLQFHLVLFKCQLALSNPLPLEEFLVEIWQQDDYDEPDGIDTAHGAFFSPEQLKTLTMKYTPNGKSTLFFCNTLINYKPSSNLIELRFTIYNSEEGIELLVKLLKASPLLRTLQIILDSETDDGLVQLEEAMMALDLELNTCPFIDDLACPATFAPVFALGRPIQKFCMEVGDYYTSCPLPDVMRSLLAFRKEILTDLNFEQTRTDNARELIPFLNGLFPNLQVLRMPMNDLADDTDTDDEQFDGIEPVDDRQINDPDDMDRERRQFESCYDDNDIKMQPEALLHFGEGYLVMDHFTVSFAAH